MLQENFYLIKNTNYNQKIENNYEFFWFLINIHFKIIYHSLNILCFITRLNQLIEMKIVERLIIIKSVILMQFIFCKLQIVFLCNFFQSWKAWDKSKLSSNFEVEIEIKLWKFFMLVFFNSSFYLNIEFFLNLFVSHFSYSLILICIFS